MIATLSLPLFGAFWTIPKHDPGTGGDKLYKYLFLIKQFQETTSGNLDNKFNLLILGQLKSPPPTVDSERGWTGEVWSKTKLLK